MANRSKWKRKMGQYRSSSQRVGNGTYGYKPWLRAVCGCIMSEKGVSPVPGLRNVQPGKRPPNGERSLCLGVFPLVPAFGEILMSHSRAKTLEGGSGSARRATANAEADTSIQLVHNYSLETQRYAALPPSRQESAKRDSDSLHKRRRAGSRDLINSAFCCFPSCGKKKVFS